VEQTRGQPITTDCELRIDVATRGWSQENWVVSLVSVESGAPKERVVVRLADDDDGVARLARQASVLQALVDTEVPAPRVLWFEMNRILGRQSSLGMTFVEGEIPVSWALASPGADRAPGALTDDRIRQDLMIDLGRVLAAVQRVDSRSVLKSSTSASADLTRRELEADVARLDASYLSTDAVAQVVLNEAFLSRTGWTTRTIAPVLRHSDYRVGNVVHTGGIITGILDWEYTDVGDPYWDLAYSMLPEWGARGASRVAIVDGYERATGTHVDPQLLLDFQLLAYVHLVAIVVGYIEKFRLDASAPLRYGTLGLKVRSYLEDALALVQAAC
jgi:aminoglycoside phosphotransferase (APT) family kinase protein